jgi:hypothetical protein
MGKGSRARNNWSQQFRANFSTIEWNSTPNPRKFALPKQPAKSVAQSKRSEK